MTRKYCGDKPSQSKIINQEYFLFAPLYLPLLLLSPHPSFSLSLSLSLSTIKLTLGMGWTSYHEGQGSCNSINKQVTIY